jgi:hypothetical protein
MYSVAFHIIKTFFYIFLQRCRYVIVADPDPDPDPAISSIQIQIRIPAMPHNEKNFFKSSSLFSHFQYFLSY